MDSGSKIKIFLAYGSKVLFQVCSDRRGTRLKPEWTQDSMFPKHYKPRALYSFGNIVKKTKNKTKLWPLDSSEFKMIKVLIFFTQPL